MEPFGAALRALKRSWRGTSTILARSWELLRRPWGVLVADERLGTELEVRLGRGQRQRLGRPGGILVDFVLVFVLSR